MDILILGGTVFLGRALVESARRQGHHITLFNRGRSAPNLFPDVEQIHGDRATDLDRLGSRHWDAVVDTSGYLPAHVRASAEMLSARAGRYVFVSTISVYADFSRTQMDEDAPLARLDSYAGVEVSSETYGALKTHCEDAVLDVMPNQSLIVRPGLIVGPHDPTDRFTYWPVRMARGREVLAPEGPDAPIQFIDVRDLADWIVLGLDQGITGIYNATGPAEPYTLGEFLTVCQEAAGVASQAVWVSPEFLAEHEVAPFMEMPLWVPASMRGIMSADCSRALAAGLRFRPVAATAADTLAWRRTTLAEQPLRAGLEPARERDLLAAWESRGQLPLQRPL